MRRSLTLVAGALCVAALASCGRAPSPIVGKWTFDDGGRAATVTFNRDGTASIMRDRMAGTPLSFRYRIDASKDPMWLDMMPDPGHPTISGREMCIVEFVSGDEMRICNGLRSKKRPTSFETARFGMVKVFRRVAE